VGGDDDRGVLILSQFAGASRELPEALIVNPYDADQCAAALHLALLAVGVGPGSFTSTRIGLAVARGLALALDVPGAGVSTLDALAASRTGAYPVVDARRGEVFVAGPRVLPPDDLDLEPGTLCVGSGAVRYRVTLERMGALVPADDDELHVPHARLHASIARDYGPVERIDPIYVRLPDAEVARA